MMILAFPLVPVFDANHSIKVMGVAYHDLRSSQSNDKWFVQVVQTSYHVCPEKNLNFDFFKSKFNIFSGQTWYELCTTCTNHLSFDWEDLRSWYATPMTLKKWFASNTGTRGRARIIISLSNLPNQLQLAKVRKWRRKRKITFQIR